MCYRNEEPLWEGTGDRAKCYWGGEIKGGEDLYQRWEHKCAQGQAESVSAWALCRIEAFIPCAQSSWQPWLLCCVGEWDLCYWTFWFSRKVPTPDICKKEPDFLNIGNSHKHRCGLVSGWTEPMLMQVNEVGNLRKVPSSLSRSLCISNDSGSWTVCRIYLTLAKLILDIVHWLHNSLILKKKSQLSSLLPAPLHIISLCQQ